MTTTTTNASGYDADRALLGKEIDDTLLQLRGLVLVRDVLAERNASRDELDAHTREVERLRRDLAERIRGGGSVAGDGVIAAA
jgi:hypothetical protein